MYNFRVIVRKRRVGALGKDATFRLCKMLDYARQESATSRRQIRYDDLIIHDRHLEPVAVDGRSKTRLGVVVELVHFVGLRPVPLDILRDVDGDPAHWDGVAGGEVVVRGLTVTGQLLS